MNNPDTSMQLPPMAIEAEQAVLGSLLRQNTAWDRIAGQITERDFYRWDHQVIFRHIARLLASGRPADIITVSGAIEDTEAGKDYGGLTYLHTLAQSNPSAANITYHADRIRERATMRRVLATCDEISASMTNPGGRSVRELLDAAEGKILAIGESQSRQTTGFQQLNPVLQQVVERIDALHMREGDDQVVGTTTGIDDLDRELCGLQDGDLIIIAGRPSMGKTAFAVNIGENLAITKGEPVAVFSMEMGATQLATRMLGSVGRIDQQNLRSGRLLETDWPRMTSGLQTLSDLPFYIDDTPALTYTEVRSRARRLARQVKKKLGLIIVDYIQLMGGGEDSQENRASELGGISRNLKSLAKEMGCPVIALSQLNRSVEQRPNKRPMMSDLRESGSLEQDADVIIFIYRDEVYNPDSPDRGTAELIIGKQRNGPIGMVRATFNGQYTKFSNYTPGNEILDRKR